MSLLPRRAREEHASIEKELLSSTSREVCELWTGRSVARVKGRLPPGASKQQMESSPPLFWAVSGVKRLLRHPRQCSRAPKEDKTDPKCRSDNPLPHRERPSPEPQTSRGVGNVQPGRPTIEKTHHALRAYTTPSLTLQLRGGKAFRGKAWLLALTGVAIQIACLVVCICFYLPEWRRPESKISQQQPGGYGLICYTLGSVFQILGILGCGYAIDEATEEQTLKRGHTVGIVPFRLQKACTVGDQDFQGFVVSNPINNPDVRFSTWKLNRKRRP